MSGTVKCPACQSSVESDSNFCRSCGKAIRKCSHCGSLLLQGVMFCPNCQAPLPQAPGHSEASPRGDGSDAPYLAWEGYPFSWLAKTYQTRRQWWLTSSVFAICMALCMAVLVVGAAGGDLSENDKICFSIIVVGTVAWFAFIWWVKYWTGRRTAELEESRRWKEP